jgi:hypothetical protein
MTTFFQSATQNVARELFDLYDSFKAVEITSCRITHADMLKWLRPFQERDPFTKLPLGTSGEGRIISLYSIGNGSTKVMLWSQMHGDEPTATMALIDIFNFFTKHPEHVLKKPSERNLHCWSYRC